MRGQEQPPQFHPEGDVFTHTALMLDLMEERSVHLAWSILLHDIGKPATATVTTEPDGSERIRFNGHDSVGAEMADAILRRLKFSNADREAIVTCVAQHMRYHNVAEMRTKTLRKIVGQPTFETQLELHRIDCLGCHGHLDSHEFLRDFAENYEEAPALPDPLVTGRDLIGMGLEPGRELGGWKQAAYDRQLEDPGLDRETLLAWLRRQLGLEPG